MNRLRGTLLFGLLSLCMGAISGASVWAVLIATVILMVGILAWGVFGRVDIHDANGEVKTVAPITFVTN